MVASRTRIREWASGRSAGLSVVAGVVGLVAVHLVWLHHFRSGYPTGWDESLYMAFALENTQALRSGGLDSLASTVVDRPIHAPLVPLTTVPIHLIAGEGIDSSRLTGPAFFTLLVFATYGLAKHNLSAGWAALAALTIAAAPVVTDWTRDYHFAVPAAALFTAALWALFHTHHLTRKRWAIASGALLGLAVLARTMTLAYVPGFALAAAAHARAAPGDRKRQLSVLLLTGVTAAAVAATWYLPNLSSVIDYLSGAGYGAEASRYGTEQPITSVGFWTKVAGRVARDLYLPLWGVLALGIGVAAAYALRRRPLSPWPRLRAWATTPSFALFLVVAEGYLALLSSANEGTAFSLPWLPALVVLGVVAIASVPSPVVRRALAVGLIAVAGLNVFMKSGWLPELASPKTVSGLGSVPIVDGSGTVQRTVEAGGYRLEPQAGRLPALHRRWLPFGRELAGWIVRYARARGRTPYVLFATRDPVFNTTRLVLAGALWFDRPLNSKSLMPAVRGDPAQSCRTTLRLARNNFLITAGRAPIEEPGCREAHVNRAARSLGFEPVRTFAMPDGRRLRVWWLDRH